MDRSKSRRAQLWKIARLSGYAGKGRAAEGSFEVIRINYQHTNKERVRASKLLLGAVFLTFSVGFLLELTPPGRVEARASAPDSTLKHDRKPADQDTPADGSSRHTTREDTVPGQLNARKGLVAAPAVLSGPPDSVVALYFHRTLRCEDCLLMEDYIRDVLKNDYLDALLKGSLRWRSVDYEQPEYADVADKYQLGGPALVLRHWVGGREVLWARMDEIWERVDYPEAVADTLRGQFRECLAGTCRHDEFHMPDTNNLRAPGDTAKGSQERMGPDNEQR